MTQSVIEPTMQLIQQWSGAPLSLLTTLIGWLAPDFLLYGVQSANALKRLVGQGARHAALALVDLIVLSSGVRPACSFHNLAIGKETVVTSIGVGLQNTGKSRQMAQRILAFTVR